MISEAIARIKVYKKANEVHQISPRLSSPTLPLSLSLSLSSSLSVDRAEGARRPICSTRELLREDRSARGRPEVIAKIRVWQETNVVRREDRR